MSNVEKPLPPPPTLPKLSRPGEISGDETFSFDSQTHWGVSDPARFQALMNEAKTLTAPGHYLSDNLFTWTRNNSVFEDGPFRKAWENNCTNTADHAIAWRRYILACAAYHAEGELAVLEHLFDCVVSGGIVIMDDYEWAGSHRPQKKAEDPWFEARNYRVFPLPTGQGLVLKR